jgi:hypothetical protein
MKMVELRAFGAVQETGALVVLNFTKHAIERFVERVRPGLAWSSALLQLQGLAAATYVTAERPEWAAHSKAQLWLPVGDAAFTLVTQGEELVATTVLTPGRKR